MTPGTLMVILKEALDSKPDARSSCVSTGTRGTETALLDAKNRRVAKLELANGGVRRKGQGIGRG